VQACAAGAAIATGGVLRDAVSALAQRGWFGEALAAPVTGYAVVYGIEIVLLLATLVAIRPLFAIRGDTQSEPERADVLSAASPSP
jgi:BCD family chlorophyll transporter-like MFS transporter